MTPEAKAAAYKALSRPSGGFAMVANDARESLRTQVVAAGRPGADDDLACFKMLVAECLGPHASGMLVDAAYGLDALDVLRHAAPECGRILAVDALEQKRGGHLESTSLDESALANLPVGLHALKLLLLWRIDEPGEARADLASRFVSACATAGVLSVLECVVDLPPGHDAFDEALVDAAAEFAVFEPDIYKTQVPSYGMAPPDVVEELSHRVTSAIEGPWVVLSNGVPRERFASAVQAACCGGASGFLAGRAAWAPALAAADPREELAAAGVERIRALTRVVDNHARPWFHATDVTGGPTTAADVVVSDAL